MLGELARVLAPGGVLAISSPNADRYPTGNPHHVREFTTDEFRALLAEAFREVRLLAQHQWVSSAVFEERELEPGALTVRTTKAVGSGAGHGGLHGRAGGLVHAAGAAGRGRAHRDGRGEALAGALRRASSGCSPTRPTTSRTSGQIDAERRELGIRLISRRGRADRGVAPGSRRRARSWPRRMPSWPRPCGARGGAGRSARRAGDTRAELGAHGHHGRRLGSVSWRCTRPLRGAKALVRAAPRRPERGQRQPAPAIRRGWRSLEHRERVDVGDLRRGPQHRVRRDAVAAHDLAAPTRRASRGSPCRTTGRSPPSRAGAGRWRSRRARAAHAVRTSAIASTKFIARRRSGSQGA